MTVAAPLARPVGRRARLWLILAALVVVGGAIVTALSGSPVRPLDPGSAAPGGSEALAALLEQRGAPVQVFTSPSTVAARPTTDTLVVAFPNDLGAAQLRRLVESGHRIVTVDPDPAALAILAPGRSADDQGAGLADRPSCDWAGAAAAGSVDFPDNTTDYDGVACYGGAVVHTDRFVLLGSADLLRNDQLAKRGVAALDINAITDDGSVTTVDWLLPGPDDDASGGASVWDLFPPAAERAFWWLLFVLVLTVLWRGRRLGPVVREPLPVVVRAAEVVEGHGRLYRRAHARARTAGALRAATTARLVKRLGLPRGSGAEAIAPVLATLNGGPAVEIRALLSGPAPDTDAGLLALGQALAGLEQSAAVRSAPGQTGQPRPPDLEEVE